MNDLRTLLDEYLATRRALGVRLEAAGRYLKRFVAFAGECETVFITTELALRWATQPSHAQPAQWAKRLGLVRGFARYANAVDPRHRIPPQGLIAHRYRRPRPYIYSDREIADLIAVARALPGTTGLRSFTYATMLALLAVTGMRTGEILNLDRDDVGLANGVLTVRDGKFGKSRHIPLHESTSLALGRYAARRDRLCRNPRDPAFFLSERGTRITDSTLRRTFLRLSRQTGLREPAKSNGEGPRLHDMRHRFAVDTLVRWYRDGVDVERRIPRLATWLGHAHVSDTYWYLSATPDLMQAAARRLQSCTMAGPHSPRMVVPQSRPSPPTSHKNHTWATATTYLLVMPQAWHQDTAPGPSRNSPSPAACWSRASRQSLKAFVAHYFRKCLGFRSKPTNAYTTLTQVSPPLQGTQSVL